MDLYKSSRFEIPVSNYPLEVSLNQQLYVQTEVISSDEQLILFVIECMATPSPTSNDDTVYKFIVNG